MRLEDGYSVLFYNVIMKMLTVISLLTTIINPFITNANGSYSNIVQASYSYGIGYFDVGTSGGNSIDSQYFIDIDINIQGTYSGYIYINTSLPSSSMTSTYYPKYISVGGNYVGSGYTNAGITSFCFKITSSSHLYVRLYYGLGTLHTYFGLQDNANQNLNWTNSGNQYVDITSISVSSFTKDSDFITYIDDIESSINTLKTYTDSVENYLLQIWNTSSNIYTTLTNMSTNITDIENILSSINNKLDTINNIKWHDFTSSFIGTTLDFETYDTTSYRSLSANTNIVFGRNNVNTNNDYGIFRLYIPIGSNNLTENDLHVYQLNDSNVKRNINMSMTFFTINRYSITLYFYTSQSFNDYLGGNFNWCVTIDKWDYLYDATQIKLSYLLPTDNNFWTLYNTLNQYNQLKNINSSLDDIKSILGTSELSQSDQQNKTNTDNFFNQVLQNLNLPSFPDKDSQPMFPILQEFIGYYGQIVGNQHMSMYRWLLGLSSVFLILKVILL